MFFKNFKKQIGADIVDISRFEPFLVDRESRFLQDTFTQGELDYCFSHKSPAPHFAGIFAAKEATSKALGAKKILFTKIEIKHNKDGKPEAYFESKKLNISVSISHTASIAMAVALA